NLVQDAVRLAPDVVVFHEATPDDALFESTALLLATAPRPVVVFTSDPDAEKMARALRAGIHAWVVDGYGVPRLRSIVHLAQARYAHEQQLREALADVSSRFEERKLVDRDLRRSARCGAGAVGAAEGRALGACGRGPIDRGQRAGRAGGFAGGPAGEQPRNQRARDPPARDQCVGPPAHAVAAIGEGGA